jgi:multidrug efflux pump subunit AcrB
LFGLVLATGIVVDDAIVVVENIERKIEDGLNPHAAAHAAMGEVTRPIISIMLVLCAVFIPVAFVSGLTGQFYRQFGITIAASTIISTFNSLTLSPALAALLLKPRNAPPDCLPARHQQSARALLPCLQPRLRARLGRYGHGVSRLTALRGWCSRVRGACWCAPGACFHVVPAASFPAQDKQYLVGIVQLPDAASLDRTESVVRQISQIAKDDARRRSLHRLLRAFGAGLSSI